ncbi:esterase-like activity of phytase family protein [Oryzifoliimicrobium ureilyticus]|uniref:esterase-like activity of phytase family protein n=1 Tax=Oryzifoliimicrobium ureilyticus TaxID=3113724 RepID=UPI003F66C62D
MRRLGIASARCLGAAFMFGVVPGVVTAGSVDAGGKTYVNQGLVAVGRIPANQRDALGETFGSGSALAIDQKSWVRDGQGYKGIIYLLPDRGYNVEGTTDYKARVNKLDVHLMPVAPKEKPTDGQEQNGVSASLSGLVLLTDDEGQNMTGLDPDGVRQESGEMPPLPLAANGKISIDAEGIVLMPDGTMFISDEYGPYIYRFSGEGKLLSATQPPKALLPMRKGQLNFSSNNPGPGGAAPDPKDPETGRQNNQGLEGLSMTPDGKYLIALLQSATRQDGGDSASTRHNTRALVYDAADPAHLKLVHEYVVPLPVFKDTEGKTKVAAQSEILALSDQSFLMLARDSNAGYGVKGATSLYRKIDLVDLSKATDIAGSDFDGQKPVAPKGVVDPTVKTATVTPFIDLNDNADLGRFGLHNGEPHDRNDLSEKWESMGIASALDPAAPDDYFLFVGNDNDFLTQNGYQVGAAYKADGGVDVDTMFQVFRVTMPGMKK